MRVLLIKTSSMGDLIHTLPALTDAGAKIPGIKFDWVVEESFAEIPAWHPLVEDVIPVALRKWRKHLFAKETRTAWQALRERLNQKQYDLVLDAQGLVKSALLARLVPGPRAGLDFPSARESFASLAYDQKHTVNFFQHAVVRMRQLFSLALGYTLPTTPPDFALDALLEQKTSSNEQYLVFLHGTTWKSKEWPESYWLALANMAERHGYRVKISGGSDAEVARAKRLAAACAAIDARPRLSITEMATLLANARGAVAVDTGFGHLAAAMSLPTVSVYGSTNPEYTGALGDYSSLLSADFPCSPCLKRTCQYKKLSDVTPACYASVNPDTVWRELMTLTESSLTKA